MFFRLFIARLIPNQAFQKTKLPKPILLAYTASTVSHIIKF